MKNGHCGGSLCYELCTESVQQAGKVPMDKFCCSGPSVSLELGIWLSSVRRVSEWGCCQIRPANPSLDNAKQAHCNSHKCRKQPQWPPSRRTTPAWRKVLQMVRLEHHEHCHPDSDSVMILGVARWTAASQTARAWAAAASEELTSRHQHQRIKDRLPPHCLVVHMECTCTPVHV